LGSITSENAPYKRQKDPRNDPDKRTDQQARKKVAKLWGNDAKDPACRSIECEQYRFCPHKLADFGIAPNLKKSGVAVVKIMAHTVLHMAKAVASKMLAAVPSRDDDNVILKIFAFKHAQDNHPRPGFSVIVFDRRAVENSSPRVVGGLGELLVAA